jgi:hypothetical protein
VNFRDRGRDEGDKICVRDALKSHRMEFGVCLWPLTAAH